MLAQPIILAPVCIGSWRRGLGVIDVDRGYEMTLFLTMATLAVTALLMPDVLAQIAQAAADYPRFGVGLLALLVLVGVWIDRR